MVGRLFFGWALCFALLAVAHPTFAQDHAENDARALATSAKVAFDAGEFAKAATLLQRAYDLKPSSALLYNLGRAHQQAGNKAAAVAAYERYLAAEPDSRDAGAVRESIEALNAQIAKEKELQEAADAERSRANREAERRRAAQADAARAERARHKASVWPWVVTGVGVSGAITGVAFGLLTNSTHASAVSDASANQAQNDQSKAQTYATVANVFLISSGILVATGVVWGIFDLRSSSSSSLRAAIGPRGVSLDATF